MVEERQYTYESEVRGPEGIIHRKGDTVAQVKDSHGQWHDADSRLGQLALKTLAVMEQPRPKSILTQLNGIRDNLDSANRGLHNIIATLDIDATSGQSTKIDSTLARDLRNLESKLDEVRTLCASINAYQGYSSITFEPRTRRRR